MRKPLLTTYARDLRKRQTDAELRLWMRLRGRQLESAKFRRQYQIGPYIVDFCCVEWRLVIELDGGQHAEMVAQDQQRDSYLVKQGYRVMRFWDNEVLTNPDGVGEAILDQLHTAANPQKPSP